MSPTERAIHLVSTNREALLAELDRHSEEEVRLALAQKAYSQEKTALAQDWLRHKEQERARTSEAREEAFRLEQAHAAERAAAAAERQVVTAERANRIAVAALIFVGASFLLSLGALFKRRR
jgi:ATPase subunit of ABC transporter with duplicated ATPase domains